MTAEFKSEGTLVVNDILAVRKIAYGLVESDESGDIVIDGNVGPLYYKVKECIREMLGICIGGIVIQLLYIYIYCLSKVTNELLKKNEEIILK